MNIFDSLCREGKIIELSKIECTILFIWFHLKTKNETEINIKVINDYFDKANLAKYNITNLKSDLAKCKNVRVGSNKGYYKLNRESIENLDTKFGFIFNLKTEEYLPILDMRLTPFLSDSDISDVKSMANFYVIIHCFENSVRRCIELTLEKSLGIDWWEVVKTSEMERKVKERKEKENRNKWITPRGSSPLYYIDWGNLVTIIRKRQADFASIIPDINFVILRFEELEMFRNIVAHNGVISSEDDYKRILIHFRDWCKQLNP